MEKRVTTRALAGAETTPPKPSVPQWLEALGVVSQVGVDKLTDTDLAALTMGVAHDVNNVLGTISGMLALLPRLSHDELTGLARQLGEHVRHAAQLTRAMVDLGRPVGSLAGPEECELGERIAAAVTLLRPSLPPRCTVDIEVEPGEHWAHVAPLAASRILLNLLLNAVEALGHLAHGRIVVRLRGEGEVCVLEVDDNGPGVPAECVEDIFLPFRSFGKPGGTGVGLWAARSLAVAAMGTLVLVRKAGAGACFEVRLPTRRRETHKGLDTRTQMRNE